MKTSQNRKTIKRNRAAVALIVVDELMHRASCSIASDNQFHKEWEILYQARQKLERSLPASRMIENYNEDFQADLFSLIRKHFPQY